KLNESSAPVTVLIPLRGLSMIDVPGEPFHWPEADQALFDSLKKNLRADIPVIETDNCINDLEFAQRCAEALLGNIEKKG
ncbi:MAG: Tm-1-like ATP-binding domain-containing protein, partial [Planctomycetota bacterium]